MSTEAKSLIFKQPNGIKEVLEYTALSIAARPILYRAPKAIIEKTQFQEVINQVEGLFRDLGGEAVTIPTQHGHTLTGFYFDAKLYDEKQADAFAKWKIELLKNHYLTEYLGLNREATTLTDFFQIPHTPKSPRIKAGLICNGANSLYQCNPQLGIGLLAKNISTLMFNYGGIYTSTTQNNPNGLTTNLDGEEAYKYLRRRVQCTDEESYIHGISLGSSVATYVATQHKIKKVVLDRYFCKMSAMVSFARPLTGSVQKFFPFPTEDLIKYVSGDVLLMRAENDELMNYSHTEALEGALRAANKPFCSITVPGSHSGFSWYRDPITHEIIDQFINS